MNEISIAEAHKLGLKWKQSYITDKKIPSEIWFSSNTAKHTYLNGLFLYGPPDHDYCFCYSTNLSFMEDLQRLMLSLGIQTEIYPYQNCECEYGIRII
jgi:hypothetical protein